MRKFPQIAEKSHTMERPKIHIELDEMDRILEVAGWLALAVLIALPIYYYGQLPEQIPTHFSVNGEPDDYNRKATIWMLPILGTAMYIGMFYLNKFPHIFNYTVEITEENAATQYRFATKMIRILNTIIAFIFAYIAYGSIQVAMGYQDGLGQYFLAFFLLATFGTIGYFLSKSYKKK